ncbi:MAG TPA: S9 family peptidase [Pyrinomonadaceae bacterium]|nr:S9 family peptidase [Pyrinomonadaceae bacterium]
MTSRLPKTKVFLLPILLFSFFVVAQAQSGWTPELEMKVKNVAAVRVSPDGRKVVYTVNGPVMTSDKSEYVSQIWLANTDGSDAVQLTYAEKSSDNPRWSPDGKMIAFTSNRTGKTNLYLLRIVGGEAEQVTDLKSNVGTFAWSPDGTRIAYVMREPATDAEEKDNKGKDDWRWIDENVKLNRLHVVNLQKDADGKREPRRLGEAANVDGTVSWSPDGKTIVFTRTKMPKADYWTTSDLIAVDVATGNMKPLAATGASETAPRFSPDGKWISFNISDDPPRWAGYQRVAIIPAAGGTPRLLAETFDVQPNVIDWSPDGKRIYFTEGKGTATRLAYVDVATGAVTEMNKGNEVITGSSLNQSGTMLGFTLQSTDKPQEAFVTSVNSFAPVQISRANAELPKVANPKTEVIKWKSPDGFEVEGLLTYPVGYRAGTKVPLLLVIHGGPAGVFTQTFVAGRGVYPVASFAAKGFAVLRPNPRGSSGYGQKFRFANIKDWGGGDYQDLMSGVDHVVSMGVADPERLGVMGWSYGGFMTSWVITQTHRFKAASVGAAVTNLMSFIGTADIPSFIPDYFEGQPWENLEIYRTHSAMFNAKGVKTPTLIQHGEADERVPISQGYEFYNALKVQNVPVRMIVLPRMPHGLTEPKMALKSKQTNLEWFEKYLGAGMATATKQ